MTKVNNDAADHRLATRGWVFVGLFALLAALTGGASRYDAIQIVPLRALSSLFLIPALYYLSLRNLKREAFLFVLFLLYLAMVVLQLLPLPPAIWENLSGRDVIHQLDNAVDITDAWRPLTLSPMRTWNVLGSLVVPATGLLIAVAFKASSRDLLNMVAGLGILNALLGLLQIVGGQTSVFYIYDLTNRGGVVGIFANENHAGIFAACAMLVTVELGLRITEKANSAAWARLVYPASFFLILLTALAGGSRAGFAAAIGALAISLCMLVLSPRGRRGRSFTDPLRIWADKHPTIVFFIPILAIVLTVGAFLGLGRSPAFGDLLSPDGFVELRWSLWPVFETILHTHWLVGTGFGSFEQVYEIFEPSKLLMPQYVNQAHNDWVQFVIEGGVLAGALLVALLAWLGRAVYILAIHGRSRRAALFWLSIFAIIAGASFIDYPLRTPLFQLVGVWLLMAVSRDVSDAKAT